MQNQVFIWNRQKGVILISKLLKVYFIREHRVYGECMQIAIVLDTAGEKAGGYTTAKGNKYMIKKYSFKKLNQNVHQV